MMRASDDFFPVTRSYWLLALLFVIAGWQAVSHWQQRALHPSAGILAPDDPIQGEPGDHEPVRIGRWTLTPRATYDVTARVLGREPYRFDTLAELIPEDLALGWGPMSDSAILDQIELNQSDRAYWWRPRQTLPIAKQQVVEHSANTHVIGANDAVTRALARLRVGQVVRLQGFLVDARRDDGVYIRTSLTRSDSGYGACEVLYVESADVE